MKEFELQCPIPNASEALIKMGHGGGGRMSQRLIDDVFLKSFANDSLDARHDAAVFNVGSKRIAVSTDGFVVRPWRFPGGNIGSLAVHGTVNDLAMAGAKPLSLTAAFILEEGFAMANLQVVVESMHAAAKAAGVEIVAGDTKVVERGKGDGVYIVTTGIGEVLSTSTIGPQSVRQGDAVLLSGDVGRHSAAVMSVREGLSFEEPVLSDSATVHHPALALISEGIEVHCMRDPTRGGLCSILNEIARDAHVGITVDERSIDVQEDVRGICELLGLDPMSMACEGRFVAFVAHQHIERALGILRSFPVSAEAKLIGRVEGYPGEVCVRSQIGVTRVLDLLSGEQLPRIC